MAQTSTHASNHSTRQATPLVVPVINELFGPEFDPTKDIRNLIEQLRESTREAKARQTVVESERDQLSRELAEMQSEVASVTQITKNLQEITTERQKLIEQGAKYGELLASLQHKADIAERGRIEAGKQRDELARHKAAQEKKGDEAMRQRDLLAKELANAKSKLTESDNARIEMEKQLAEARKQAQGAPKGGGESQKQMLAVKQARDSANIQVVELKTKIGQLEDELADFGYQLERSNQKAEAATNELLAFQRQLNANQKNTQDCDAIIAEQKAKIDCLATENAALSLKATGLDSSHEAAETAATLRKELEALAGEREREMSEFTSRLDSLRTAHESELALARQQQESAWKERDLARLRAQEIENELETARQEAAALKASISATEAGALEREKREAALIETMRFLENSDETLRTRAMEADRRADFATREMEGMTRSLEDARNSLIAANRQLEFVISDRDTLREQAMTDTGTVHVSLKEAQSETARLRDEIESIQPTLIEYARIMDRFERQRLETIEISAQLENAQREIKEMGANLAEARLMVKNGDRRAGAPMRPIAASSGNVEIIPKPPQVEVSNENAAMRELVSSMQSSFQTFTRRPGELSLLHSLVAQGQQLADLSKMDGAYVLHRVTSTFGILLKDLYRMPEQVTPATLRTINQTIEFLASLLKQQNLDEIVRFDTARVYTVDDDSTVCDSVSAAMRAVGLRAKSTTQPGEAMGELVANPYDLVILDVHVPELNGFELCTHIRNMPLHADTPIIFLSGDASMENRVQSSLRGGNDFVTKPFNFQELGLKALILMLRSQLKMA